MQNKTPKVTIVTITYNLKNAGREKTFQQCVESVHNQTYKNIEHLVIDGASTDGSLDLIKEYADKGWIKYISEPDTGIYDAMNKGLKLASGEYIAFLNSDDFYHDMQGIQHIVDCLISNKADFTYAPCRYLKEDDTYYGMLYPKIGSFFVRMPCSHQSLFVNTELMRKLGGFDTSFKSAGDYDFVIRLCLSGAKSCECYYNFVSYRLGGLSDKQQQQSVDECKKSFKKNYKKLCRDLDVDKIFNKFVVSVDLYNNACNCVSEEIKTKMKQVWNNGEKINDKFMKITDFPSVCVGTKVYLFEKIPVMEIKTYYDSTQYWLFGFLKLLTINADRCCYLFGKIPFLKVKNNDIFLFGLPFMSRTFNRNHEYNQVETGIYNFSENLPFETNGLSSPESWGCWSDGEETSLFLKTNSECFAQFDVNPFLTKGKSKQAVTVYVNGRKKQKCVFKSGHEYPKIDVKLPKSNKLRIVFKYNDVKSPAELGISDDPRKLALGFKTMEITNEDPGAKTQVKMNFHRLSTIQNREGLIWGNTWIEKPRDLECERVLLIGASGPREYRRHLQNVMGKPVDYIGTSLLWMDCDFYNLIESFFKSDYKYSLILLDLGNHSPAYNTKDNKDQRDVYKKGLLSFVKYLRKKQKNVILFSPRPIRCENDVNKYDDSVNREVVSRSEIAREVADELKLNFIDTYNYIYNNNFVYRDFVHFAEKIDNFRLAKYIDYDIAGPTLIEPKIYGFSENLPFFVEGLCLPEPWGCWSNGDCSFFFFRTDNEYIAEFDVKPFFAKEKTKQVVTVYVNCREQGEYVFESGKEIQKIIIDLPKSEKIHIMFKYKDVESPKDLGLSDDDRKIAIGFKSMEIKNKQ